MDKMRDSTDAVLEILIRFVSRMDEQRPNRVEKVQLPNQELLNLLEAIALFCEKSSSRLRPLRIARLVNTRPRKLWHHHGAAGRILEGKNDSEWDILKLHVQRPERTSGARPLWV